jgi:hypothetical protein
MEADRKPRETPLPGEDPKIAWSCLVDDTPQIWSSITPWLATATLLAGIEPSRIHVHHACALRPEIQALCATLGVNTIAVEPFDARSPHCNKIRQCASDFGDADRIVLTDVDIVFAARPPIETIRAPVAGKLVDGPNPPMHILEQVFSEAGLPLPARHRNRFGTAQAGWMEFETLAGNFNGGLYILDAACLPVLDARWAHWARWLLERIALLGNWKVHVDQVAFCLALAESGWTSDLLTDAWNFPTHRKVMASHDEPILLHHHGRLDAHQRLQPIDAPQASTAIARANRAIEQFQRTHFDNRRFWNHRYTHHPALGSGEGSRGDVLQRKQAVLAALIPDEASVLDWGCGDLETARILQCREYVGVDVSVEALRIAQGKRPHWTFVTPPEFESGDNAPRDVVICLDVLIHQPDVVAYRTLVERLLGLARHGAIISGYDRAPEMASHITYFHESLAHTLDAIPRVAWRVPLLEYRDTTLYFVATGDKPSPGDGDDLIAFARRAIGRGEG